MALIPLAAAVLFSGFRVAAQPAVANVQARQVPGTTRLQITYDLGHAQGQGSYVTVEVSKDGGATYLPATGATGTLGGPIAPGGGKTIIWEASATWPDQLLPNVRARITATDTPPAPDGMVLIPAGDFVMGDTFNEGSTWERPTRTVYVSAFYLAVREVTLAEWREVRDWALTRGYTDLSGSGFGKGDTHPVCYVSWYEVVKWLNARSEKEGLTPVYYTNDAQTTLYRTGNVDVTAAQVKWSASGYRLPTEAEWEKAARGGTAGQRFPWGNTISHAQANYYSSSSYSYDVSATRGYHPTYYTGVKTPYTAPVGSFAANGYGLYDMAGNVWEWCWDLFGSTYYGTTGNNSDPRGTGSGSYRVGRGGGYWSDAFDCRTAFRRVPNLREDSVGFRPARGSVP